ncbi:MAG: cell division protein ZapA [Flavobacteriaceae bacterium]
MQKIKISIADRIYPLSVSQGQEARLRASAKKIDEMMNHYEQNYAVQDKQDVLAMCALQLAVRLAQEEDKHRSGNQDIETKLHKIHQELTDLTSA